MAYLPEYMQKFLDKKNPYKDFAEKKLGLKEQPLGANLATPRTTAPQEKPLWQKTQEVMQQPAPLPKISEQTFGMNRNDVVGLLSGQPTEQSKPEPSITETTPEDVEKMSRFNELNPFEKMKTAGKALLQGYLTPDYAKAQLEQKPEYTPEVFQKETLFPNPATEVKKSLVSGGIKVAEGLTSKEGLATLGLLTAVPEAGVALIPSMIKGGYENTKGAIDSWKQGDYRGAGEQAVGAIANLTMAGLGARGTYKGAKADIAARNEFELARRRYAQNWKPSPADTMAESWKQQFQMPQLTGKVAEVKATPTAEANAKSPPTAPKPEPAMGKYTIVTEGNKPVATAETADQAAHIVENIKGEKPVPNIPKVPVDVKPADVKASIDPDKDGEALDLELKPNAQGYQFVDKTLKQPTGVVGKTPQEAIAKAADTFSDAEFKVQPMGGGIQKQVPANYQKILDKNAEAQKRDIEARGQQALDEMPKPQFVRTTAPTPVKDIYGEQKTFNAKEDIHAYPLRDGKVYLKDGEKAIVNKNQYENFKNRNIELGKEFLGEVNKQVTPIVRGEVAYNTKYSQYNPFKGIETSNPREILLQAPSERTSLEVYRPQIESYSGKSLEKTSLLDLKNAPKEIQDAFSKWMFPKEGGWNEYRGSHWDEPNVVAHARTWGANINGKKVLAVGEIQSDWAREGRQKGFKQEGAYEAAEKKVDEYANRLFQRYKTKDLARVLDREAGPAERSLYYHLVEQANIAGRGVPSHPYLKNWTENTVKEVLRYAAENGYDGIMLATGQQTADMYDLSKHISELNYIKNQNGNYFLTALRTGGQGAIDLGENIQPEKLSSIVGKDIAQKIMNNEGSPSTVYEFKKGGKVLSTPDLKVGGEWAHNLYDKQIPNILNSLTKKWGGKVEYVKIPNPNAGATGFGEFNEWMQKQELPFAMEEWKEDGPNLKRFMKEKSEEGFVQPYLEITPQMREMILTGGQPAGGGKTIPEQKPEDVAGIHLSEKLGLEVVDPKFFGEGFAKAEQKRSAGDPHFVKRSYFYQPGATPEDLVKGGTKEGYRIERSAKLYDMDSDPLGLQAKAEAMMPGVNVLTEKEYLIKQAGYDGYKSKALEGSFALFSPSEVLKKIEPSVGISFATEKTPFTFTEAMSAMDESKWQEMQTSLKKSVADVSALYPAISIKGYTNKVGLYKTSAEPSLMIGLKGDPVSISSFAEDLRHIWNQDTAGLFIDVQTESPAPEGWDKGFGLKFKVKKDITPEQFGEFAKKHDVMGLSYDKAIRDGYAFAYPNDLEKYQNFVEEIKEGDYDIVPQAANFVDSAKGLVYNKNYFKGDEARYAKHRERIEGIKLQRNPSKSAKETGVQAGQADGGIPDVQRPASATGEKQRGFAETVEENTVDPALQKELRKIKYKVLPNVEALGAAQEYIKTNRDEALARVFQSENHSATDTAIGMILADEYIKKYEEQSQLGNVVEADKHFDMAMDLLNAVSSKATTEGQAIQILSRWPKLSQEGIIKFLLDHKARARMDKIKELVDDLKKRDLLKSKSVKTDVDYLNEAKKLLGIKLKAKDMKKAVEIWKKIESSKTEEEKAQAVQELIAYSKEIAPANWIDKLLEFRNAMFLTSPTTHIVNLASQATMIPMRISTEFTSASIEMAKHLAAKAIGKDYARERYFKEGIIDTYATLASLPHALKSALEGWKLSWQGMAPVSSKSYEVGPAPAIKGIKGKLIRFPFHALAAEDGAFYTMNYDANLRVLTYRYATSQGFRGAKRIAKMEELAKNTTVQNQAHELALEALFRRPLPKSLRKIAQAREEKDIVGYGLKITMPFFHTPMNVPYEFLRSSPLAIFTPEFWKKVKGKGGGESSDAIARAVLGSLALATLITYGLGEDDNGVPNITASAPKDIAERRLWQINGIKPYTVKIPGTQFRINYQRLTPGSFMISSAGNIIDTMKNKPDANISDIMAEAVLKTSKDWLQQPFVTGMNDTLNAMLEPERYGKTFLQRQAGSLIPAGVRRTAQAIDPTKRKPDSILGSLETAIPGLSQEVRPQRDIFGEEIKAQPPLGGDKWTTLNKIAYFANTMFNPFATGGKKKITPIATELYKLRYSPSVPEQKIRGIKLSDDRYDDMLKVVGGEIKEQMSDKISDPNYQSLSPEDKVKELKKIYNGVVSENTSMYFEDQLDEELKDIAIAPIEDRKAYVQDLVNNGTIRMESDPEDPTIAVGPAPDKNSNIKSAEVLQEVVDALKLGNFMPHPAIQYRYNYDPAE